MWGVLKLSTNPNGERRLLECEKSQERSVRTRINGPWTPTKGGERDLPRWTVDSNRPMPRRSNGNGDFGHASWTKGKLRVPELAVGKRRNNQEPGGVGRDSGVSGRARWSQEERWLNLVGDTPCPITSYVHSNRQAGATLRSRMRSPEGSAVKYPNKATLVWNSVFSLVGQSINFVGRTHNLSELAAATRSRTKKNSSLQRVV